MQKIIGVTEMQRNFRAVFDEVTGQDTPYVLTRGSRPEAALIPYKTFLRFMEWEEQETLKRFDSLAARVASQNEAFTTDEVAADVADAIQEARAHD